MTKYFALHVVKGDPAGGWEYLNRAAPEMTVAMAEGRTLARILKIWNPYAYGRGDYIFSLWEAETLEDVKTTLALTKLAEYVTTDLMPVTEIDWTELAEQVKTSATA